MQRTKIPWATHSWGVVSGCNGPNGVPCPYCYAKRMSVRFNRSFEPTCHPEKLDEPLSLKAPARIFVDSNGDLFDPAIPDDFIDRTWAVMSLALHHTFLILTKRPERMLEWVRGWWEYKPSSEQTKMWTLPNVWLGVTAEDQQRADERIPILLGAPAAVRFVSIEPLLGPIDFARIVTSATPVALAGLQWCIVGDDSSPGAKMPPDAWVEKIIDQCRAAQMPVFVKGRLAERFPYQEFPEAR